MMFGDLQDKKQTFDSSGQCSLRSKLLATTNKCNIHLCIVLINVAGVTIIYINVASV